jgi:hypothetical protein
MRQSISVPAAPARTIPVPARDVVVAPLVPAPAPIRSVSVAMVWHDTLAACAAQSHLLLPWVLAFALINSFLMQVGAAPFGTSNLTRYAIEVLVMASMRGVAVWIGVRDLQAAATRVRAGLRCVSRHWLGLIVGSMIYTTVMISGAASANAARQELQGQLSLALQINQPVTTLAFMNRINLRTAVIQLADSLVPRPDQPYEDWPAWHSAEASGLAPICNDSGLLASEINHSISSGGQPNPCADTPTMPEAALPAGIGGLALLYIAEILLRFRLAAAVAPAHTNEGWLGVLTPLVDGVRVALRCFWCVSVHVWLLRLGIAVVGVLPFLVPTTPAPNELAPIYNVVTRYLPGVANPFALFVAISTQLVNALLISFSLVYDARLYARLSK